MKKMYIILFLLLANIAIAFPENIPVGEEYASLSPTQFKAYLEGGQIVSVEGVGRNIRGKFKQSSGKEVLYVVESWYGETPFLDAAIKKAGLVKQPRTRVKQASKRSHRLPIEEIITSFMGIAALCLLIGIVLLYRIYKKIPNN